MISNKELAKELHKPIIRKNWEKKSSLVLYRQYDLADMQLISSLTKEFGFL